MSWFNSQPVQTTNRFRPQLDDLENRVVPDSSSTFTPGFFEMLGENFQSQAGQQTQQTTQSFTNVYQGTKQQVQQEEAELQQADTQTQQNAQAEIDAVAAQDALVRQQLQQQLQQVQQLNKDDDATIANQTQAQINAVNASAATGTPQPVIQQETSTILLTTRQYYINLANAATALTQQLQTLGAQVAQGDMARYNDIVATANAQALQIQQAEAGLLNSFDTYQIGLLNQYEAQIQAIQQNLQTQINQLQAEALQAQIAASQQQQAIPPAYNPPSGSSGSSGTFDPDGDGDDDTGLPGY